MLELSQVINTLPANPENVFVAYSGGLDSHVLLHLLCSNPELKSKITAVYVHHGLQDEATHWAKHCDSIALALGVKFICLHVDAKKKQGQSQEEAARNARYSALKVLLTKGDILLLAQHREDQMETVLLQLFRGAGVQGLSGMPVCCDFGLGQMSRPLLDVSKQAITEYADFNQLRWVEDPSNQSNNFDRNFLRNQIVPQLKQRWPAIDKTVSRSARHCAANQVISEHLANQLLDELYDAEDQTLNITLLLDLDENQQQLLLRQWLVVQQQRMLSEKMLKRVLTEVATAQPSANPEVKTKEYCIRRYRHKLYCLVLDKGFDPCLEQAWNFEELQFEYKKSYFLTLEDSSVGIDKGLWKNASIIIKFRQGKEKVRLPKRQGRHSLKKLFQEKSIPPWQRDSIPLIYLNGSLAAVGDLWVASDYYSEGGACYRIMMTH